MNCQYCTSLARHKVTGGNGAWQVCDDHLEQARKAATLPRTTELLDLGLLDPGGGR